VKVLHRSAILPLLLIAQGALADKRAGTPDDWPAPMPDPGPFWLVTADRLESTLGEADATYAWDVHGWFGYDRNRLRWKTEGNGQWGDQVDTAEFQILFSRLFAPNWEWQVGLRHDTRPGDGDTYAVFGVEGRAPYMIEIDAGVFVRENGIVSARLKAEYDLRLTQRLILQPRIEVESYFDAIPEARVESGDTGAELQVRLRYEIRREFAPYLGIGVEHFRSDTEAALLAGLQFWF